MNKNLSNPISGESLGRIFERTMQMIGGYDRIIKEVRSLIDVGKEMYDSRNFPAYYTIYQVVQTASDLTVAPLMIFREHLRLHGCEISEDTLNQYIEQIIGELDNIVSKLPFSISEFEEILNKHQDIG